MFLVSIQEFNCFFSGVDTRNRKKIFLFLIPEINILEDVEFLHWKNRNDTRNHFLFFYVEILRLTHRNILFLFLVSIPKKDNRILALIPETFCYFSVFLSIVIGYSRFFLKRIIPKKRAQKILLCGTKDLSKLRGLLFFPQVCS